MKYRIYTAITIIFIVSLLQSTFFNYIEIMNIKPSLLIVAAICVSLMRNVTEASIMGAAFGLSMDILMGKVVGWYTLLFLLICFAITFISGKLYHENKLILMVIVFLSSLIVESVFYIINFFFYGYGDFVYVLSLIVIPEAIINSVFSILIYPILKLVFDRLDSVDRIHTRL